MIKFKIESLISTCLKSKPRKHSTNKPTRFRAVKFGPFRNKKGRTHAPYPEAIAKEMKNRIYTATIIFPDATQRNYCSVNKCKEHSGLPVDTLCKWAVFYEMAVNDIAVTEWTDPEGRSYLLFFTRRK